MIEQSDAEQIIEGLRTGIPPKYGSKEYSAGNEAFLEQVRRRHLNAAPGARGKIRFVSGSWGSGKSHFLSQIRDIAFEQNYLVSLVRLSKLETPFNKFEEVFYRIVKEIASPELARERYRGTEPLGEVFRRNLFMSDSAATEGSIAREIYDKATEAVMQNSLIDIDFRRLICRYWETFLPEAGDPVMLADRRSRILQWFSGEGTIGAYRKELGVQKLVDKSNARLMLQSLGCYASHAGYSGIVVLFDEAEMSYSVMRRSELKTAHNNLLHLINSIEESPGLFLIYATTPDFYTDERHGIHTYGALSQRIGRPEDHEPRALDRVWNLDQVKPSPEEFDRAANNIRTLYAAAYPECATALLSDKELHDFVIKLHDVHPRFSAVGFWRVLVAALVHVFDLQGHGIDVPLTQAVHDQVMETLKES